MDVWGVFVGDTTMSYGGSVRHNFYRDYEQFPYGTLEHNNSNNTRAKDPYSRVQEKCRQVKSEKALKKECPFCKEHKKRPLINYMRKRESRKHHESICEDEEEEEENNEEQQNGGALVEVEENEHAPHHVHQTHPKCK